MGLAFLPSALKRILYRALFGYRIARGVRIGLSVLDAGRVELAAGTVIGHLNVVTRVDEFRTGPSARLGFLNLVRGGERVSLGAYCTVLRLNVLNAIPDNDCTTSPRAVLEVGDGSVIVSEHRIDFTDTVRIGRNVILAGRASSLWTHNRQETAPIGIGDFCYVGSEVRLAPGASLAPETILGLGSVLVDAISEGRTLVAGVPARVVRPLTEDDLARLRRKTDPAMPDDWYERVPPAGEPR